MQPPWPLRPKLFPGVESDEEDSTQAELPLGQFQLAKSRRRKRRRPEAELLAAGSPLKTCGCQEDGVRQVGLS